uniref:Transposase (Putative), gypsy type n=1 Tax=Tanacetum cinerariifolium TaxID=118510 RepID=A0A699HJB1_TANCI|nr:transposase (putative), gypsy type [Tanacetum cinerariifolium]
MSTITDVKCVLTQKELDAFCNKFHIPVEVHHVLPNQNDTMHERPAGKLGCILGFLTFPTLDCLCPPSLLTYLGISTSIYPNSLLLGRPRDPSLVAAEFNAQDYATLVAHPSPFRKFPEAFMCLVGLSRHYTLDEKTYPRFLHKNREGGHIVPMLPVAPNRTKSELKASVDRLFYEGGSGNQAEQGDSARGKMKSVIMDAGEVSHPPKKLKEDHGTSSGTSVGGKSWSAVQRLLAGAVLNAEVKVAAIPTLPFVTAYVSTTPELEDGDHTDSVAELNLHTIGAPSSVLIMTNVTIITLTVEPTSVTKEKLVEPSAFGASFSTVGGTETTGVFSDLTGSDFLVGVIRTVTSHDTNLQKLFTEFNVGAARQMSLSAEVIMRVEYNVKENRRLKSVVERQAEAAKAILLRVEASTFEAVEKSFWDETNALRERNTILEKERNALDEKVIELETSVASKERELTGLNSLITFVHEMEISSFELQEKVTIYQNCMEQLEKFQDDQMKFVNDKSDKLYTDFVKMALHLEEKFYPHILTIISSRIWLLTQGMKLAIIKCMNSPKYLSALEAAISKAIEKGMQDGLSAGITHGKEGKVLTDVAAYNPSAKLDYISALQQLQNVNFPLLTKLKSNKDASIETVIDILRLEGPFVDKLGLDELQPNVDQLMVPIHHSPDKVVIGATALSLSLDVSSIRVRKIKENIANHISTLRDVFVPLAEPFSATALTGTEGTSDAAAATADATTALSTTFASASTIAPIFVDDYEVIGVDDQAVADGDPASFPNVDDAKLNIPQ